MFWRGIFNTIQYVIKVYIRQREPVEEVRLAWENYLDPLVELENFDFFTYLKNSVEVTTAATVITLVINSMAAFALSKYQFKGRDAIFVLFISTLMIPITVILAMRLAQLSGGAPVVGSDLDERRLELAKRVGADETLIADENVQDNLRALLGAAGAEAVIELTGAATAVVTAFQLAARSGRVVLAGSTRGRTSEVNFYRDAHRKGLLVIGGHESTRPQWENSPGYWTPMREYAVCLDLMARGRVQTAPLITHRYNWREFPAAYAQLANWDKEAMGMMIEWD